MTDVNDIDNAVGYKILKSDFKLMIAAVASYKGTPTKVFIRKAGVKLVQYVTWDKWIKDIKVRWDNYTAKYGEPDYVWINHAAKPALILQFESVMGGTINSVMDWLRLLVQHGVYAHYNCVQHKDTTEALNRVRNQGLNCADYVYLTIKLIDAFKLMGKTYSYTIQHVDCDSSSGRPSANLGHFYLLMIGWEFTVWTKTDPSEAASGGKLPPKTMCTYGDDGGFLNHNLC